MHDASNFGKRLSKQLYSKDTRFVYELIQNAEDNNYSIARDKGMSPSLDFTISPNEIVIDSNEDGFNEENVRAICKIGGSTKTASSGFIGEKGIGFKSVFKIASKVRVQSGPFCFAFDHGDDDHGLGMVTPINEDHEHLSEDTRTRFKLSLNQHSSFEVRVNEFQNLPDTLLLFLTKLKRLTIRVHRNLATNVDTAGSETVLGRFGANAETAATGGAIFSATNKPAFGSDSYKNDGIFGRRAVGNVFGGNKQKTKGFDDSTSHPSSTNIDNQGTGNAPFKVFQQKDPSAGSTINHHQSISCMEQYGHFSVEVSNSFYYLR